MQFKNNGRVYRLELDGQPPEADCCEGCAFTTRSAGANPVCDMGDAYEFGLPENEAEAVQWACFNHQNMVWKEISQN